MSKNKCEVCGANLDPGEVCDCVRKPPKVMVSEKEIKKLLNKKSTRQVNALRFS